MSGTRRDLAECREAEHGSILRRAERCGSGVPAWEILSTGVGAWTASWGCYENGREHCRFPTERDTATSAFAPKRT